MEQLIIALKISLIIMAIYASGWKEMIFYSTFNKIESIIRRLSFIMFYRSRADKLECNVKDIKAVKMIVKPLFRCPICMSSFYTLLFWIIWAFSFNPVLMILYVAGINTVLTAIIAPIIPDNEV